MRRHYRQIKRELQGLLEAEQIDFKILLNLTFNLLNDVMQTFNIVYSLYTIVFFKSILAWNS